MLLPSPAAPLQSTILPLVELVVAIAVVVVVAAGISTEPLPSDDAVVLGFDEYVLVYLSEIKVIIVHCE